MDPAYIKNILNHFSSSTYFNDKISLSILIVVFLFLLKWVMSRFITTKVEDVTRHYYWQMGIKYVIYTFGIILVSRVWFEGVASVATFLGLVGAGLAIAMQDVIASMVSFAFIVWRRPFVVGDRVQLGDDIGDVIDIRLFQTLMMEINSRWVDADNSTGRILHMPNNRVFKDRLVNYDKGFGYIWYEMGILVTFESNWRKAKEILLKIISEEIEPVTPRGKKEFKEVSRSYLIRFGKMTPIVYLSVKDSGVMLTLRFLIRPRKVRDKEDQLWTRILEEFDKNNDIDFAYQTTRMYFNQTEGKSGAQAALPKDFLPFNPPMK